MKNTISGPVTPEEFQRQMAEFMRQHLSTVNPGAAPQTGSEVTADKPDTTDPDAEFKFDYKPRDIKDYLDRFVIKQDSAKKVLSVALCDHYHQVRMAFA